MIYSQNFLKKKNGKSVDVCLDLSLETVREEVRKLRIIISVLMSLAVITTAYAHHAVELILNREAVPSYVANCTIDKKPEVGMCAIFAIEGKYYFAFANDDGIQVIREMLGKNEYKQVFTFGERPA